MSTLYALLQRKSQETYENLLHAIVDKCSELHQDPDPTTVVIDFEMAMVHAVSSVLGDHVTVQGCFYHLTLSTWRKVQDLGLTQRVSLSATRTEDVKLFCGMMDSLALLPIDDLPAGLEFLRNNTPEGMKHQKEWNLFSTTSTPPTVLVPTEGFNATLQMVTDRTPSCSTASLCSSHHRYGMFTK